MKVYIVINAEAPHKDSIVGVYSQPEYAHYRARIDLMPETLYWVFEEDVENPGAGFVSVAYRGKNQYVGLFKTPNKEK